MALPKFHKFDSRVVQRHLRRKVVAKEDYEAHLASLEDCAHLADLSEVEFIHSSKSADDNTADS